MLMDLVTVMTIWYVVLVGSLTFIIAHSYGFREKKSLDNHTNTKLDDSCRYCTSILKDAGGSQVGNSTLRKMRIFAMSWAVVKSERHL